jgi:cobalt-zinc-cadmium efflux system outer membrane protein
MRTTKFAVPLLTLAAFAISAPAKDRPFAPVEEAVKDRTRHDVRWERDLEAREESRTRVRQLLKRPLTVSSAVQVVLLNNRGLQATFEEIGLSFADVREARTLANPEADLSIKFPNQPPKHPLYEWDIAQNFLGLLLVPLRTKVAKEKLATAQLRVSDEVIKLTAEVKTACYELLADQSLIDHLRVIRDAQSVSLELMQKLHEAGNVTDLKLTQEQVQYSQLRLELARSEAELREHREKLNRLLGVWGGDTDWKLAETEFPRTPDSDFTTKGLETLAVANRLDLAAARAELESAAKALGLEKTFRFIGALDFGIAGEHEPDGLNLLGPSVRFELPLFNQGQARVACDEARLRMAAAKFEQLAIDLRSKVRALRDRLISKREIARFYRDELLPSRHRITALTLVEYNAMLVGAFDVFSARREDLEAERSLIEATRDYWITRAELERAVGGDLEAKTRPRPLALTVSESKSTKSLKPRKP